MDVLRAKTAGFCMGVSLALQNLENALLRQEQAGASPARPARICTLGPIIHNPQVLEHYAGRGVACVAGADELAPGDHVLIRAHGLPREEEARVRASGATVEDATCPRVKGAQLSIARATRDGASLLLFGEAEHPEVRGLLSYAAGEARVFGSLEELMELPLEPARPHVLASQTTQDRDAFAAIEAWLGERLGGLTVLNTICGATRERQEEARRIAGMVDVMVVVGGRESGNTRRLAALAAQAGVETFHVERPGELDAKRFATKSRAGLTAGASTPKSLIDAAEEWLASL
ncbi:4-hydroxy-3-methylbut-2-enyl diphosphate reductase [Desulfovibrio sp.]|uniref:4-hydroxy-3-methylbut-2-enyl diphosphate reductase n=1 Tax=Desulfovibrio sp. TaxID=885 RepID=UPI0023C1269A|nr:4-hydroxy-3-methylbut-2-enyl diphosphate reductase [Desulfovibrio sp.]MDE7241040.1 4-hydroxy-3-methylbut-2-enyl diphosphate reductase [Desulfovibrio sp.]